LGSRNPDPDPSPVADTLSTPDSPPAAATRRRRGHGRRPLPANLPRERVEIDLTDAEKACPHRRRTRIRPGADVSAPRDYRPPAVFVGQVVRPPCACRGGERAGDDPQVARSPLPPEPIPRGTAAAGLLAHLIVSKSIDHLPLYRQ